MGERKEEEINADISMELEDYGENYGRQEWRVDGESEEKNIEEMMKY